MKKKILIPLLTLPVVTTLATTIATYSTQNNSNQISPANAATKYTVSFKAKEAGTTFVGNTEVKIEAGTFFASVEAPTAYKGGYVVDYWIDENDNRIANNYIINNNLTVYPHFDTVQIKNCIGLSAISDSTISVINHGDQITNRPDIQYSLDGKSWQKYNSFITLKAGQSLYFKGNNPYGFSKSEGDYTSFSIGGSVSLIGNVMTLIDDGQGTTDAIPSDYCFYRLFESCSGIVSISSNLLPATRLKKFSYAYMFDDCTNLTDFPKSLLPATSLYTNEDYTGAMCYAGMFANCTGLTTIPVGLLKATSLAPYCYYSMFQNCLGLTKLTSGILPATLVPEKDVFCYCNMFNGCKNITQLPEGAVLLPSQTLADSCYYGMFSGCEGLTDLSQMELPATNLEPHCYDQLFYNCTNLTKAPIMKGTTLKEGSYFSMFYNCKKLTDVTPFPADTTITLAPYCCQYMFNNCEKLVNFPALPKGDIQLYDWCFAYMFQGCTSLASVPNTELQYTKLAIACYESMFARCSSLASVMTVLPATTLFSECYCNMFNGCDSLVDAPALPAEKPASWCYASMFYGCDALKTASISLKEFDEDAQLCLNLMFAWCQGFNPKTTGEKLLITIPAAVGDLDCAYFAADMFTHTRSAIGTPDYGTTWYC